MAVSSNKRGVGKPRKNPTRSQVNEQMDNIKTITTVPVGYIPAKEFALKCGISAAGLTLAKNAGKFSSSNLRWVKFPGRSPGLYYHWESQGPAFIRQRDRARWPEWFQESEAIRDAALESDETNGRNGEPTGSGVSTKMSPVIVKDLNSAKLRSEQLKIEKQELELQKAKNEVLDLEEVEGLITEITQTLCQAILSVAPRLSPLVAAENSPHACLKIIDDELRRELQIISGFKDFIDAKKRIGESEVVPIG